MKLKKIEPKPKSTTVYKKVPYRNKDSVKVIKFQGVYKKYNVSIIFSDDHMGWLFYIEKGKFNYNSMRSGELFTSKEETILKAESYIDNLKK